MKYTKTHEWIKKVSEGEALIGISDHAQAELSDVVYVEMPEVGLKFEKGEGILTVESVKASSDIYAPVSGEVVEVNSTISDQPEKINESPEDEGWLIKVKMSDPSQLEDLLSQESYKESLENPS